MSGNNMESLLMGGDDSSSGESDDEVNVPMGTATTAASAVTVAPPRLSVPTPAPKHAPVSTQASVPVPSVPAVATGKSTQADNTARLKSLYNISKSTALSNTNTGGVSQGNQAAPKPVQRPPMHQSQRPPQQKIPQQRKPHQQMPQRQLHQPVGTHQANQQQHKRTQLYQQSSQQTQQQQQMNSRSQAQQRHPQYSHAPAQQRQQYPQQQQQPMPTRPQTQQRQPQYSQPPAQQRQQYVQQSQQQRQPQSRGGSSSQQQNQQAAVDPYAPTPLSQIKQSQHNRRPHQQQQIQSQRQSTQPTRMQQLPGTSSTATPISQQEVKRQKEKFLMFTRVLIKYLEQKDPRMHQQAKVIIKDCAERNKRQEPGYESVTQSMKRRLKDLVGDHYWKKANDYLVHFIEQKRKQAGLAAGRSGSSSAAQQQSQQMRRRQASQQMQQRQAQQKLKKEQTTTIPKQRPPATANAAPSIADVRKGIQDKREQLTVEAQTTTAAKTTTKPKSKSTASSKASGSDSKTTTKAKSTKKPARRKSTGDASATSRKTAASKTAPASSSMTTIVKRIVVEEPPREYKELMELIDHAVEYKWPSIGQLLGNKADLKLTDEERQLLYGDITPNSLTKKKTTKSPTKASTSTPEASRPGISGSNQDQSPHKIISDEQNEVVMDDINKDGIRSGWGRSNVLSARAAWARIRLKELRQRKVAAANSSPVIADGLLTLPTAPQEQQAASDLMTTPTLGLDTDPSVPPRSVATEGYWVNEESAEQDKALALLSEGCQIYLKGVLQKAVQCARQRQNLDGIRLWHQQYAFNKGTSSIVTGTLLKDKSKKPPLALRLGCDVSRQAAQAQGNAALTVKRMEEALDRQTGIPMRVRELNTETLHEATSMGDLSWRPLLKQGAEKADYQAKRSFEVYGGKEAKDPPLGRVPKKAKLLVEDFVMGSELTIDGPYHKAYTASSFISF